ncbi:carboxypeptidase B-like [Cydia pomonella]|uniref:carboxypeptidase B-like n=1 Tax=Cydia pomonella TaxID=82600 RepID=UPI002ADE2A5E|nr:carboxypeptidase B-like [Cydia pomonella]
MLFLFLISLVPLAVAKNELYMGYKVYNVKLTSQLQHENLHLLKEDIIDYWIKPNFKYGVTGLAMVPPSHFRWFEERLDELKVDKTIAIDDVYEYLSAKESKVIKEAPSNAFNNEDPNETYVSDDQGDYNRTGEKNFTDEDENGGNETEETNVTDEDEDGGDETEETNVTDEDEDGRDETEEIDVTEESEEDDITFSFDDYYRYNTILDYIYKIRDAYVDSQTTSVGVVEFGSTDLNRPLVYLKLTRTGGEENKHIIVIEGGINPREWITIPSALKIVEEVLESNQARYLDNFDWIVVPVVNPDGYEYTHTDLRLWEKNLSTKSNLGFICPGVNINRNFNIDWSRADSSSSACSHLYAGTEANSEIETQLIQSIIDTYRDRISMYVSLQNGGGYISYPWQYEFAASGTFRQNHLLAMEMVAAMQDEYHLDTASVAYGDRASGTSSDYARTNDVLYAFNIDIIRRGTDGVIVPENEIVDIVEDVWRAVSVAADNLIN